MAKDINDILGISKKPTTTIDQSRNPIDVAQPTQITSLPTEEELEEKQFEDLTKSFDNDFVQTRNNLLFVMDAAKEALSEISLIARDKEGAKEYDALNGLLKTLNETSRTLLEVHEKRKKFLEAKKKSTNSTKNDGSISVNNAVFVGSSTELKKFLRDMKEQI